MFKSSRVQKFKKVVRMHDHVSHWGLQAFEPQFINVPDVHECDARNGEKWTVAWL